MIRYNDKYVLIDGTTSDNKAKYIYSVYTNRGMIGNMGRKEKCVKCGRYAVEHLAFEPTWKCMRCGDSKPSMTQEQWKEYRRAMRG
jgi:hypothetical protein